MITIISLLVCMAIPVLILLLIGALLGLGSGLVVVLLDITIGLIPLWIILAVTYIRKKNKKENKKEK